MAGKARNRKLVEAVTTPPTKRRHPSLDKEGSWSYGPWYDQSMDDKYNVRKSREPETKQEVIQHRIEELVKRRDNVTNLAEKEALQKEIMKLFAQYERLKL